MKKKILVLAIFLLIVLISMPMLTAQSFFLNKTYTKALIQGIKNLESSDSQVAIEINEMKKSSDNKTIGGVPKAYELYVSVEANIDNYFDNDKYLSGLYMDESGIYDIANGSFFDAKHHLTSQPEERFLIEGTKVGTFYLILTLSNEVPYFGDFMSPNIVPFNQNDILGEKYVNNVISELKDKGADVFFFELDSTSFE